MYVYGGRKLEKDSFFSERNIVNIYIEKGVSVIDAEVFKNCKKLEKVILPNDIKEIGDFSFADCENLKYINLPNSIENIGNDSFLNCKNLTIYCNENSKAIDYAQKKGIKFKGIESFDSSLPIPIMEVYKTCKGHPKNISPGYCKEDDEFSFVKNIHGILITLKKKQHVHKTEQKNTLAQSAMNPISKPYRKPDIDTGNGKFLKNRQYLKTELKPENVTIAESRKLKQ